MKSLVGIIKESLVNEARVPAEIRKLGSKATEVSSRDFGDGWLIGRWVFPYSEDEAFSEMVNLCLKTFGGVIVAGKLWKKPIDMDGAIRELERNGEEPEGQIGFVLVDGEDYPELMSDIFFG